jgi:hypothetical protein
VKLEGGGEKPEDEDLKKERERIDTGDLSRFAIRVVSARKVDSASVTLMDLTLVLCCLETPQQNVHHRRREEPCRAQSFDGH